jgi:energy-coupling factor transport system permease protein
VRLGISPGPGAALLAAAGFAALLADRIATVAAIALVLLLVCLRAPAERRGVYLYGALFTGLGVLVVSPFLWSSPEGVVLWEGPTLPVLGPLDITTDELYEAALNALRLTALALAFSAYALLLDHDRLVAGAGFARRSALAVALATRLVPSLERDAAGLAESVRGRGVELRGVRGHAALLSPLVAGSLERATTLAEAMEARGFGRHGTTRAPRPAWSRLDRLVLVASVLIVTGSLWL